MVALARRDSVGRCRGFAGAARSSRFVQLQELEAVKQTLDEIRIVDTTLRDGDISLWAYGMAVSYDPVNHVATASLNGVVLATLPYTATAPIKYVGVEGSWNANIDNFTVQSGAIAPAAPATALTNGVHTTTTTFKSATFSNTKIDTASTTGTTDALATMLA